jgi:hypothetical protein
MSFIDWSDPEEMFGLLVEYVADEQHRAEESARRAFLSRLRRQLEELQERFEARPPVEVLDALRAIRRSMEDEFESDPVVEHLSACVEELERIHENVS